MSSKKTSINVKQRESDVEGQVDMNVTSTSNFESNVSSLRKEKERKKTKKSLKTEKISNSQSYVKSPYFLRSRGKAPLAEGLSSRRIRLKKKKTKVNKEKLQELKKNQKKVSVGKCNKVNGSNRNDASVVCDNLDEHISLFPKGHITHDEFEKEDNLNLIQRKFSKSSSTKKNLTELSMHDVTSSMTTNNDKAIRSMSKFVKSKRIETISRKSFSNVSSCTQTKFSYDGLLNKNTRKSVLNKSVINKESCLSKELFQKNLEKKLAYSAASNTLNSEDKVTQITDGLERTAECYNKVSKLTEKTYESTTKEFRYSFDGLTRPPLHHYVKTSNENNKHTPKTQLNISSNDWLPKRFKELFGSEDKVNQLETSSGYNRNVSYVKESSVCNFNSSTNNDMKEVIPKDDAMVEGAEVVHDAKTESVNNLENGNVSIMSEKFESNTDKNENDLYENSIIEKTATPIKEDEKSQSDMNTSWWSRLVW